MLASRRWLRAAGGALCLVLLLDDAHPRDPAQRAEFQRTHPCPTTGATRGACPGYVVDHVTPLCAGGLDRPSNMQWQTVLEAKVKDQEERRLCAELRARPR